MSRGEDSSDRRNWSEYDRSQGCEQLLTADTLTQCVLFDDSKRKVTDPFGGLMLLSMWALFVYVAVITIRDGDIKYVLYGRDYLGRLCGNDFDEAGEILPPYWYPVDIAGGGICLRSCPTTTSYNASDLICKDEAKIRSLESCSEVVDGESGLIMMDADYLVLCGACMYQLFSLDVPILHYCLPEQPADVEEYVNVVAGNLGIEDEILQIGDYAYNFIMHFTRVLIVNWKVIMGVGVMGTILLGFTFLLTLRIPGFLSCNIWLCTLLVPLTFAMAGYYCGMLLSDWKGHSDEKIAFQVSMYVLYALSAAALLLIIYLRRRIQVSISIANAAARSVMDIPSTIFYPFIQIFGFMVLLAIWIPTILFLASTGDPEERTSEYYGFQISYISIRYPDSTVYTFWFLLGVFFWTSEFIRALSQVTLAICFSKWYFSENKRELHNVSLTEAMSLAFYKHFGTAAVGSCFISVLQIVRFLFIRIQRRLNHIGAGNRISNIACCCCQGCIFFLERWLKFLSQNAFVETAIFGFSYCRASREAYYLINRHSQMIGISGFVSDISLLFGKVFVISGCSFVSILFLEESFRDELDYTIAVIVGVGILSYFIIDMFADVLDMAVCTVILCFIADEEMHGTDGSRFVPTELVSYIKSIDRFGS